MIKHIVKKHDFCLLFTASILLISSQLLLVLMMFMKAKLLEREKKKERERHPDSESRRICGGRRYYFYPQISWYGKERRAGERISRGDFFEDGPLWLLVWTHVRKKQNCCGRLLKIYDTKIQFWRRKRERWERLIYLI